MTPLEIKIAMMKSGITQRQLARELGINHNTVYLVINKGLTSRRIMEAISKAIGIDKSIVFPNKFQAQTEAVNA